MSMFRNRRSTSVENDALRVTVLHEGGVIAEGAMENVKNDPRVIEVYLGR